MTSTPDQAPGPSPWLSVWLSPRTTIERILATDPKRHVLLLAALNAMGSVLPFSVDVGLAPQFLDWRIVAVVVLAAAILGVVVLYISGFLYRWSGRLLGGRASPIAMRAVLAWGQVPGLIALVIWLAVLIGLTLSGDAAALSVYRGPIGALQVVTIALGLWSVVVTMLMLARAQGFGFWRTVANFILGLLLVSLIPALLIRTFLLQPFNIPSAAMTPTLLVGDYVFVAKYPYGYTRYSLPFSPPLLSGRILGAMPARGDVVVFRLPSDDSVDYIKRVVGLPGDRIQMIGGVLHINRQPVPRERAGDLAAGEACSSTSNKPDARVRRWRETLPNGVSYETLECGDSRLYDDTAELVVPAGHLFMLGDNRQSSTDSRVPPPSGVGYVPIENVVGRAAIIYFSVERSPLAGLPSLRLDRLGLTVR